MSALSIIERLQLLTRGDNLDLTDIVCADAISEITQLVEAIQQADAMISVYIDEHHDFDYPAHAVPPELQQLRDIQHHLAGSLIAPDGLFVLGNQGAASPPKMEGHVK
jgi:hypothetical protein